MDRRIKPGPGKQLPLCDPVHPGPFPGLPGQLAAGDVHALRRMWGILESEPDDLAGTPEKSLGRRRRLARWSEIRLERRHAPEPGPAPDPPGRSHETPVGIRFLEGAGNNTEKRNFG